MRIQVNGIGLNAEVSGDGPPLLLLHGFTGSARSWDRFVPAWRERHRVIAVDLIGHGESDAPGDAARYTMEHAAGDLAAVLDALEIEAAAVLGYSMGGRTALSLAALHPERVSALLLESASPGLRTREEREARMRQDEALAMRIEQEGIEAFVQYWENIPLFQSLQSMPEELRLRLRAQRLRNSAQGLAHSLRGMGTGRQPSWWDELARLPMPVLLTAGEWDEKFVGIARLMEAAIPRSAFVPVQRAGHMVHVEQAEIFDKIIIQFLRDHGSFLMKRG